MKTTKRIINIVTRTAQAFPNLPQQAIRVDYSESNCESAGTHWSMMNYVIDKHGNKG